jgi:hypothetical protein
MSTSPTVKRTSGVYDVWFPDELVNARCSRLRDHSDRVTTDLVITTSAPGTTKQIFQANVNLQSSRFCKEAAEQCRAFYPAPDWLVLLESVKHEVVTRFRQGDPVLHLSSQDDIAKPGYVLRPFILDRQPSLLFGLGGTGKSYMALAWAMAAQAAWVDNHLGLGISPYPTNVLYLDWETERDIIQSRVTRLTRGLGLPPMEVLYRRCSLPLADDIERIQEMITDEQVGAIIVDSAGPACGGDLNATDATLRVFNALRTLECSSLILSHAAKNVGEESKARTPYGNAFWWNCSRSVWEAAKQQDTASNIIQVGLYHKKANDSRLENPIGYTITFDEDDDTVTIRRGDVRAMGGIVAQKTTLGERILFSLRSGRMRPAELAVLLSTEEKQENEDSIRVTLHRMQAKNLVHRMDDKWGLLERSS